MRTTLVAVVPAHAVDRMRAGGRWYSGRASGATVTLLSDHPTEDQAMAAGRRLPRSVVWAVEATA